MRKIILLLTVLIMTITICSCKNVPHNSVSEELANQYDIYEDEKYSFEIPKDWVFLDAYSFGGYLTFISPNSELPDEVTQLYLTDFIKTDAYFKQIMQELYEGDTFRFEKGNEITFKEYTNPEYDTVYINNKIWKKIHFSFVSELGNKGERTLYLTDFNGSLILLGANNFYDLKQFNVEEQLIQMIHTLIIK